jgi:hypothetical protein
VLSGSAFGGVARREVISGCHQRRLKGIARYAACYEYVMARRDEITLLLREVGGALDDDEIAARLGMNRHYVNQVCRQLAREGLTTRSEGSHGKVVNRWMVQRPRSDLPPPAPSPSGDRVGGPAPRRLKRSERARSNVEGLVSGFPRFVGRFERSNAFPGPSLYFHERAIERRREHRSVAGLMSDERFFEYVYAVLPAWGMHRMGKQAAKVGGFGEMVSSFRSAAPVIEDLWDMDICRLPAADVEDVACALWRILESLRVSTSATRIVAGSKALHHVLPALVPPIDRQYTFQFFTGQKAVTTGDERAFLEWFPFFVEIGDRAMDDIGAALRRGGFMATGPAKIIDNAIIGFMQADDGHADIDQ